VFSIFSEKFPVVAVINDYENYIEKDILVTEILDPANLNNSIWKDLWIVVEVNGIYHYPRNSTEMLGWDELKKWTLEALGYKYIAIPYFDWNILENDWKPNYIYNLLLDEVARN